MRAWDRLDRVFYLSARPHEVLKAKRPGEPDEPAPALDEAVDPMTGPPWERPEKAATTQMAAGLTPR